MQGMFGSRMPFPEGIYSSRRVNQIDSFICDKDVTDLLKEQLLKACGTLSEELLRYAPELKMVLEAFLWYHSMFSHGGTFGQAFTGLVYRNSNDFLSIRLWQKCAFGLCSVILPYMAYRVERSLHNFDDAMQQKCLLWLHIVKIIGDVCSLLHFYYFLIRGGQRSWIERACKLIAVHEEPPSPTAVDFYFMNRELLWHGFADILIHIVPMVKLPRLFRYLWHRTRATESDTNASDVVTQDSLQAPCNMCEQSPMILPVRLHACGHIMCYACLYGRVSFADDNKCPLCDTVQELSAGIVRL